MLTVAEARALITTSLTDAELEDVIAREEAWLARRIGPLDGERIETFAPVSGEALLLQRPASAVDVEDDSGAVTVALRGWSDVFPAVAGAAWSGPVEVTYTPSDEAEVTRALVTLVRLTVSERAFASEAAGAHSYSYDHELAKATRWQAWHSLLRPGAPSSLRLTSSAVSVTPPVARISIEATGS